MGNKRLLTLTDLYNFYSSAAKSCHFSSKDDNENLVVQVEGKIKFEKSNKDTEGLLPVYLQSCHIDKNLNGSNIKKSTMSAALPSFSNRPILGYIHKVNDQYEFYGHNMHMEDDELVYDEVPVGIIPESCEAKLVYDEDKDNTYVEVKGFIFEEYSPAASILEREGECSVSVELSIRELSYDSREKYLDIEDFFFSGVTILGKNELGEKVNPGMAGSNIKLADFSEKNNSVFSHNDKLVEVLERLNDTLSNFSYTSQKKGGNDTLNLFEELLQKYNKTVEEITFEYEDLTDEELEAKFAEMFSEDGSDDGGDDASDDSGDDSTDAGVDPVSDENGDGTDEDEGGEPETNPVAEPDAELVAESDADETDETGSETDETAKQDDDDEPKKIQHSVTVEGTTKEFSVSLSEIIYSLATLVNDTYSDDGTYYSVDVFADEKYVIMVDCWGGRAYKQSYKVKKDSYSLTGDRVEVFSIYVTADERKKLDDMRANYELISDKLAKYEAEPAKIEVLESEDYAKVADTEEFVELKKQENHFDLTVEEVTKSADDILLQYAKAGKVEFAADETGNKITRKKLPTPNKKVKRYGNMFD